MAGFSLDIKNFVESFNDGAEKTMRGTAISVFEDIVLSTPVDEGRARASWVASGAKPSTVVVTFKDYDGSATVSKMKDKVLYIKDWSKITLTNNLPYIVNLEFGLYGDGDKTTGGYSKQAPQGMVRINMNRAAKILNEQARKHMP